MTLFNRDAKVTEAYCRDLLTQGEHWYLIKESS